MKFIKYKIPELIISLAPVTLPYKILNCKMNNISVERITFLNELDSFTLIKFISKFRYFDIYDNEIIKIKEFLHNLDNNSIYSVIPLATMSPKLDDPYIILSKQILITQYSNPYTLHNYLNEQLRKFCEDFNIEDLNNFRIYLKFRKIDATNK
jgi:hypothetical protein